MIIQPNAIAHAGMYVSIATMPSRDNQEVFHWDKARHARSGWPRCKVEDRRPRVIKLKERNRATRKNHLSLGK